VCGIDSHEVIITHIILLFLNNNKIYDVTHLKVYYYIYILVRVAFREIANISLGYVSAVVMSISDLGEIAIIQNATVGHLRTLQTFITIIIIIIIVNTRIMVVVTMVSRPAKE